jgi:hypothetical protein
MYVTSGARSTPPPPTTTTLFVGKWAALNLRLLAVCGTCSTTSASVVCLSPPPTPATPSCRCQIESVQTSQLVAAIRLARQLQCRTEQASWIFEVAETLLELRLCVKEMDYKNMMRLMQAVRATDKSHVNVRHSVFWLCVRECARAVGSHLLNVFLFHPNAPPPCSHPLCVCIQPFSRFVCV